MRLRKTRFHAPLKAAIWHTRNITQFWQMMNEECQKRARRRLQPHLDDLGYPKKARRVIVRATRH